MSGCKRLLALRDGRAELAGTRLGPACLILDAPADGAAMAGRIFATAAPRAASVRIP